jgi:ribonuclease D
MDKSIVVYDIETDGYLDELTMMSVAWTYDMGTGDWMEFDGNAKNLIHYLNTFDIQVAHHGYGFDIPALKKITGLNVTPPLFDTMVAARLRHPDILGGHSLKAWGKRLGILKGTVMEGDEGDTDVAEVYGTYSPELS